MTEETSPVDDLRSRWHTLCDLDRAQAVQTLQEAGVSLREIAAQLNCSRSLLSRLLRASKAPSEDLASARQFPISTRELARRAGTAGTRGSTRHHEATSFELERAAVQGSRTILSWLDEEEVAVVDREQIMELARVHMTNTDKAARNEQEDMLQNMSFDEADRQSRLGQTVTDRHKSIPWSALRLAFWILRRIPDGRARARAFDLASCELRSL